jgi:hypothetical protein
MAQWSVLGVVLGGSIVTAVCSTAGCGSQAARSGFMTDDGGGGTSSGGGDGSMDVTSVLPPGDDGSNGFGGSDATFEGGSSGGGDDGGSIVCPPGLMCNVPCPAGSSTTISGTVYDPAMLNPLYNIAVYVPQKALTALPAGVVTGPDACQCGALFKSGAVVYTTTDEKGQFTLTNAPAGTNVQLVLQVGKWRRVVTIPTVTACMPNVQPDKSLALNGTVAQGSLDNMPDIAVSTGHSDTLECLIKRIGVPNSEFVPGTSTAGHVHIYNGGDPTSPWMGPGTGGQPTRELTRMPGATESDMTLWDSQAHLMPYDILLLSCEGGPTYNPNPPALEAYLNAGGRAFASHFHYQWFVQPPPGPPPATPPDWAGPFTPIGPPTGVATTLATWTYGAGGGPNPGDGVVVQTLNTAAGGPFPKGVSLDKWLGNVGALVTSPTQVPGVNTGDLPIYQTKFNAVVTPMNTPSQPWLTTQNGSTNQTMYFSFDTPVNPPVSDAGVPLYCGRGVFSDLHVDGDPTSASFMDSPNNSMQMQPVGTCGAKGQPACTFMPNGMPPPVGCASGPLSPQEKVLEFMLFDLSSCVISDRVPPPKTIPVVY